MAWVEGMLMIIAGGAFLLALGFSGTLGGAERTRERWREEENEPGLRVLRRRVTNWSLLIMVVAGAGALLVGRLVH